MNHPPTLPHAPGIYQFKDKSWEILYIGKAKDLHKRVSQYFSPNSVWKQEMLAKADKVDIFIVQNESEALYLESNLIKQHKPFYNTLLKGWNGYAYIRLSSDTYPQISITRNKKNDWATYIWPKHNSQELKKLLQYLRQLLKFRTCWPSQFRQSKICSDFYFWLCEWWCVRPQSTSTSPDISSIITSFFRWNTSPIQKEIKNQIHTAIQTQNFERAAKLRDIYLHIEQLVEKQNVELEQKITGYVLDIRQFWERNVFVLLNFYEWRLIDIIRDKVPVEEWDQSRIIANLEAELNTTFHSALFFSSFKLTKSLSTSLQPMIDKFFDSYVITASFTWQNPNNDLLHTLQTRYWLKNFPYKIECLDISHLWWSRISGWLSSMTWWLLDKRWYRRYKIRSVSGQSDDYASLEEVILKRFASSHDKNITPDLFILDWWKWQLWVIQKVLNQNPQFSQIFNSIDFISLGKWEARQKSRIWSSSSRNHSDIVHEKIYKFDQNHNIIQIPLTYDQADRLLIKLRDEAHRFSNAYRKKQMQSEIKIRPATIP